MNRWMTSIFLPLAALILSGCTTPDQRIRQLQNENQRLLNQTKAQEQHIASLTTDNQHLTEELTYFTRRSEVLEKEKTARLQESQNLRKGVRQFTDEVMKIMRDNYKKTEIVDYIGSELYQRQSMGSEVNQLLVDMLHPLSSNATLIGGRVYVMAPTRLVFCLLRPSADQKEILVVDMSRELAVQRPGEQQMAFEVPMAAHKGDLIGAYCPETVAIPYDDVDTGYVVMVRGPIKLNASVSMKPIEGRNKRAYSFGVMGFLDKE